MHPILKKLQFKGYDKIVVINNPDNLKQLINQFAPETEVLTDFTEEQQTMIFVFCYKKADIDKFAKKAVTNLIEDGLLWMAYPKKSSKKYHSDITRDEGWDVFKNLNFRPVRQIAIDDDWSALRFRHTDYVK